MCKLYFALFNIGNQIELSDNPLSLSDSSFSASLKENSNNQKSRLKKLKVRFPFKKIFPFKKVFHMISWNCLN